MQIINFCYYNQILEEKINYITKKKASANSPLKNLEILKLTSSKNQ